MTPLVGRAGEVSTLERLLDRLADPDPRPQLVWIDGISGIGKTRLLDELIKRASDRGAHSHVGRVAEPALHVPFGLFASVFAGYADPAPVMERLNDEVRAALDVVRSTPGARPHPGTTGVERYRLYRTLRALLARGVPPAGSVLVLDDGHLADAASLEFLDYLLREPPHPRFLIAVAYRTWQAPARLVSALRQTRFAATQLSLGPLRAHDVGELCRDQPLARRKALFEVSRGNPLHLTWLSRIDESTLDGLRSMPVAGPQQLPPALRSVLNAGLDALTEVQARVVHTLAVAGDGAHLDLLLELAGRPRGRVHRAIDELVARDIIRCDAARFSFCHPLQRAAAYQAADTTWRIDAHRRVEGYLRRLGAPVTLRAHHAAAVGCYGDHTAVEVLVEAAVAVLATAPATAAHWLRTALACLPDHPDFAECRATLMLRLSRALNLSGGLLESRQVLHEVLAIPTVKRAKAIRYRVVTERLLGRLDESKALLELEVARETPMAGETPPGRGAAGPLLVELAGAHLLDNEFADCSRHALAAITDAHSRGDPGQQAAGTTLVALAALHGGDPGQARFQLATAVPIIDALSDAQLRDHLHLLPPLAWLELHLERYREAERHVRRGIEIARGSGRTTILPYLSIVLAACATRRGQLDRALAAAADATEMSLLMGSPETLAMARSVALPAELLKNGAASATKLVELLTRDGLAESRWWAEIAHLGIAATLLDTDQAKACADHLQRHTEPSGPALTTLGAPQRLGLLAVALARQGLADKAIELADRSRDAARALGLAWPIGFAHLASATVLAGLDGPTAAAVPEARAAAENFTAAGAPLDAAIAQHLESRALAACGDLAGAQTVLERAKDACLTSVATSLLTKITRTEVWLAARAHRTRRARVGSPAALSSRERQIAQLVATGMTNKQIAGRLYLSPKTIEAHLARVFAKLEIHSRLEVATRLTRESQPN